MAVRHGAKGSGGPAGGLRDSLGRAVKGDPEALAELYDATAPQVHALLLRMLGNATEAEEATVELYAELAQGDAPAYDPLLAGSVPAWLLAQARSRALARLRERGAAAAAAPAAASSTVATADAPGSGPPAVAIALALLTPEERRVLEAAYFDGLPPSQAARRLGLDAARARQILREAIARFRAGMESAAEAEEER